MCEFVKGQFLQSHFCGESAFESRGRRRRMNPLFDPTNDTPERRRELLAKQRAESQARMEAKRDELIAQKKERAKKREIEKAAKPFAPDPQMIVKVSPSVLCGRERVKPTVEAWGMLFFASFFLSPFFWLP